MFHQLSCQATFMRGKNYLRGLHFPFLSSYQPTCLLAGCYQNYSPFCQWLCWARKRFHTWVIAIWAILPKVRNSEEPTWTVWLFFFHEKCYISQFTTYQRCPMWVWQRSFLTNIFTICKKYYCNLFELSTP